MPEKTEHACRSQAWVILGLLALAYLFIPFHRSCLSILSLDIMRDMDLGPTTFGVLSSAFFLSFGLMQIPAGILNDTLGPRKILPLFMGMAGLGALCMGIAENSAMLVTGRILVGLGISVIYISNVKIVANWFPPARFAAINGLFVGTGGIGMILASGPLAYVSQWAGWRMSFLGVAIVCVLLGLLMKVYVFDSPAKSRAPDAMTARDAAASFRAVLGDMALIVKDGNFWALCIWTFCQFTLASSFAGLWGGAYLAHVHGLDKSAAGEVLNMMGVGLFAGAAVIGWLAGRVLHSCKLPMLFCSVAATAAYALLALFGARFPVWGLYAWFFFIIVLGLGPVSLAFTSARLLYSSSLAATAGGLLNTLPSFGVVLLQPLTGYILESYGQAGGTPPAEAYATACIPFILLGIAAAVAILFFREKSAAA